jgi:uncharacterized NAD-dependent epimerase/dehydratase family protein
MLRKEQRLALYMEGNLTTDPGKMGFGILRYSENPIACVIDSQHAGRRVEEVIQTPGSAPVVATVEEAAAAGAEVFVLGIAPPGGLVPPAWWPVIDRAVELGLSVVNGLHDLLAPRYPTLQAGQWVWDVRLEPEGLGVATGRAAALANRRVLMIGTDMAVGKMTAGLELWSAARRRGLRASFVATGQIGIVLTGTGVPLDAVRVDFAGGAIEREVLDRAGDELVIVEGQGALCHPGSTSTLPLLRGACPTHLVLCHRAGQTHLRRLKEIAIPPLKPYIRLYEELASTCGTFPTPSTVGVALNTSHLGEDEAREAVEQVERETGLPTTDPVRHGVEPLLSAITTNDA